MYKLHFRHLEILFFYQTKGFLFMKNESSVNHMDPKNNIDSKNNINSKNNISSKLLSKLKSTFEHDFYECRRHLFVLCKWILMGLVTGCIVGLVGTAFSYALVYVNDFRSVHPWILFGLPFAGLLIVFLYRILKDTDDTGTNMVIASIHSSTEISYKMAPLIFITTVLTHLCGGSAGREGAAIQLGGSITNFLSNIKFFKFSENDHRINIMCGMSAGFSALFGTPLASAFFSLEVISVGIMHYSALVPCVIASYTAHFIASYFKVAPEAFTVLSIPSVNPVGMLKFLILGAILGVVSILFCAAMHNAGKAYTYLFKNAYLRIFIGGCMVVGLTLLLRTNIYLGSGMNIIEKIFETDASQPFYIFLLKIIFTALTIGAGFKGGEIVPSFCIGAACGAAFAPLLGMPVTLTAACGMVGVFCGVTNCPVTSLLISFELFGFEGMPYYLITIAVSYMLSGYYGLYSSQRIMYSKTKTQFVNTKAH